MALLGATATLQALNSLDATGTPANQISHVALHTATTGTTGTNENAATGGYARQACTWNAASGTTKTNSTALTFTTAGTVAVTHAGAWSALTAGNFGIGMPLSSSVTAATITIAAGALTLSAS